MYSEHPSSQSEKGKVRAPGHSLWDGERQKKPGPSSNCPHSHLRDNRQSVVLMSSPPQSPSFFMEACLPSMSTQPQLEPSTKLVLKKQVRFSALLYTEGQRFIFLTKLLHGTRRSNWKRKSVTWQEMSALGPCPSDHISWLRWTWWSFPISRSILPYLG